MRIDELQTNVVEKGLCIGCGICNSVNAGKKQPVLRMEYSSKYDHFIPILSKGDQYSAADVVCPGAEMNMPALALQVHGREPENGWLGEYRKIAAAHARDNAIRTRAASGGVTSALLMYLFNVQAIDAVYCVTSDGDPYTRTGRVVRSADDLRGINGSVYQPTNFGAELDSLIEGSERFAFVGLPCEIAALERLKLADHQLAERHILSIGLFCGGINRYGGVDYYLKGFGASLRAAESINYRHGAWPGKIRLVQKDGKVRELARIRGNSRWKIIRYIVAFQGYWMLPRCRICPDQISDFADIAVGDPHLPRFRNRNGKGFSAVVIRTERGQSLYEKALESGVLEDEALTEEELVESQGYTLDNRRHALAYMRVAKWLRMPVPDLKFYAAFSRAAQFRHYKYALVDLGKIKVRNILVLRPLYIPFQIFEYLFVTFAPRIFIKRLINLFSNK